MGNANGREEGTGDLHHGGGGGRSNGELAARGNHAHPSARVASSESMANATPPASPRGSVSPPILFASQVPVAPVRTWNDEALEDDDFPPEKGIPILITWTYGSNNVGLEGSWDNWTSRRMMQRSGKDFSILLVLPSGVYHYRLIVDGECRYIPDLPFIADETGHVCNILDVNDYVPENLHSVAEFEAPSSPESSYGQAFPAEEDFSKEPALAPSQLHVTVLGNSTEANPPSSSTTSKPQHVVLNHLFIEKGWPSQSMVAMGLTHRFESKYVTVVLYKPLKNTTVKRFVEFLIQEANIYEESITVSSPQLNFK